MSAIDARIDPRRDGARLLHAPAPARDPAGGTAGGPARAGLLAAAQAPAFAVMRAALWASLVPLTLLLRPYGGLAQDARIYLGRGVADRDPAGVGRDAVFTNDGQNGFSVMARAVDALLGVFTPGAASALLAGLGLACWLAAAVALALRLERGRAAWAIVVALLALPAVYGGFNTFGYAEAIATPRVFAEAAVLGGFAALLGGRTWLGLGLVLAAGAAHPLMALPGAAVAAALLAGTDRRWGWAVAAAAAAVLAAALLGAPLVGRLLVPFDPAWAAVLRMRSVNLFPTLWSAATYLGIARRLATVLVAASLMAGPARRLMLAGAAVAAAGLGVAALFGDAFMAELVTQLQPWRALWLAAVLGNAGAVIAAVRLWRGSSPERLTLDRLTLAALACAWLSSELPMVEIAALAATLSLRAAALCGGSAAFERISPRAARQILKAAAVLVACLALFDLAQSVMVTALVAEAAWKFDGEGIWRSTLAADLPTVPVLTVALTLACASGRRLRAIARVRPRLLSVGAGGGLVCACALGAFMWDDTPAERGAAAHGEAAAALRAAIGPAPGEVMWIDEDNENWFLAGRPAFFDTVQGAPILFSRPLALEWAERAALMRDLGWARAIDIAPWTAPERRLDPIALRPDAIERFCADRRRPAAVVAPGDQRTAAPAGWAARLWRPAVPFRRMWVDAGAIRWARWDAFTVVRCPREGSPGGAAAGQGARSGDAHSLG